EPARAGRGLSAPRDAPRERDAVVLPELAALDRLRGIGLDRAAALDAARVLAVELERQRRLRARAEHPRVVRAREPRDADATAALERHVRVRERVAGVGGRRNRIDALGPALDDAAEADADREREARRDV